MSDESGFLIQLGVKTPDLIAGFAGGVVNAIALKRSDPWSIIGSVIVGGLTANYLTDVIAHYTGTSGGRGVAGVALRARRRPGLADKGNDYDGSYVSRHADMVSCRRFAVASGRTAGRRHY